MEDKRLSYGVLLGVLLVVVILLAVAVTLLVFYSRPTTVQGINNFEDCVKAGYPIIETYPRQCNTPDGRTFVSPSLTPTSTATPTPSDLLDAGKDVTCQSDIDCQLVNEALGFSCCWAGTCDQIDYSLDKWIAINRDWFREQRIKNCPSGRECGPAPMCNPRPINVNFTAKCVSEVCQKVAK